MLRAFSVFCIVITLGATLLPVGAQAQSNRGTNAGSRSPLWGDLVPGPHAVGFKVVKLRDRSRSYNANTATPADYGYPLILSYWYPASGSGPGLTFRDYQRTGSFDDLFRPAGPQLLAQQDADLKAFYERPFNFPFGPIEDGVWARLGPTPLMASLDLPPAAGRFPLVAGVGAPGGNQALGEFLASHGYVVALVGSPANVEMNQVARMEWFVRDLEFALASLRDLPNVDATRIATWGFSFAGMPALMAAMRSREIDAVVSLESAIFYQQFAPQMTGNPFYSPTAVRVPFLHMIRAEESRPNEDLTGFQALRYSQRYHYLLNDTALVHQDFGTHGIAAAAVLEKRPHAVAAVRLAQRANAEYILHFLDAHVRGDQAAATWLARTPEQNGFPAGAISLELLEGIAPAPTPREFMAWVEQNGVRRAMERFLAGRENDPQAPIYQEQAVNQLGYQLMASGQRDVAIEIFQANTTFYPTSANTYDSLSEAYETIGDSTNAVAYARKTLEAAPAEARLPQATRDNLVRISEERIRRLGGGR